MAQAQGEVKPKEVEVLEEDDEFEEFEDATWTDAHKDKEDVRQWHDDWDDDDVDDDFTRQLRQELEAGTAKGK